MLFSCKRRARWLWVSLQWLSSGMKCSVSVFMVTPQHIGSLPSYLLFHGHRMFGGGKREKVTPPISVSYVIKAEAFSHYHHTALHLLANPGSSGYLQLKGPCTAVAPTEGNRFRPARLTHCLGLGMFLPCTSEFPEPIRSQEK